MDAERSAQRAMGLVWSDETPLREFIPKLAMAGDRAAALRLYERFRTRLWDELELEPSEKAVEVAEAIRSRETDPANVLHDTVRSRETEGPGGAAPEDAAPDPAGKVEGKVEPSVLAKGTGPGRSAEPWKLWFYALAIAAFVCFAFVGILRVRGPVELSGPPPPDRPFTVLAQVAGGAAEDDRECVEFLLRTGLDVSHVVHTVPRSEVRRAVELMDRNPATALDPSSAREVATRLGVGTVVLPRLDRLV